MELKESMIVLGFSVGLLGHAIIRLAAKSIKSLATHTVDLEKVIFSNLGSEEVYLAGRVARAFAVRVIAKMVEDFDGWFDEVNFGNVTFKEAAFEDGKHRQLERTTVLCLNDFRM